MAGDSYAQFNLAGLYYQDTDHDTGRAGISRKDAAEYADCLEKWGMGVAQFHLALYYEEPEGLGKREHQSAVLPAVRTANRESPGAAVFPIRRDCERAVGLYSSSADQGNTDSQLNLSILYSRGDGVQKDVRKSEELLTHAAEGGNGVAQYLLGVQKLVGQPFLRDNEEAFRWLMEAARNGVHAAEGQLGIMFLKGIGTQEDTKEAKKWLKEAYMHGDEQAREYWDKYQLGEQ